jgi:haloalkane dehalogenase
VTFNFNAGTRVYQLKNDKGKVYIMNSFSQAVDNTLQMGDLENLGSRLELPNGWTYSSYVLESQLSLSYPGEGIIVQDNFFNTYSMVI